MTRVALVINTPSIRRRIMGVLSSTEWEVVDSPASVPEGPAPADVVVAEVEALGNVSETRPIALVDGVDDPFWHSPFRHRVAGVVGRDDPDHEFVTAVREVLGGRGWVSPELALMVLCGPRDISPVSPGASILDEARLTQREKDVVLLVAEGYSNNEIAMRLCIGVSTVKFHVSNALRKLECRDRAHLAVVLHKRGSVPLRPVA
ncbi:hypothetical protein F0L17_22510 [Streptomyces sp. TRM43335]|uniref:HTH luxR-type domain-containing protein n=1 Tax=Streptomyces taklimakanensis TaxID=2569853 RepID=A0A6G2BHT2_9ACTN|nr:response regulator transcription factor [Streptomyces taklimakanensis]MTE21835.1 hypothetical protein [Streptomyces taklimakanensis]